VSDPTTVNEDLLRCDEVIIEYSRRADLDARVRVARAILWKGTTLWESGRSEDALAVWREVDQRYGDATEPELLSAVEEALRQQGLTLMELKRRREAFHAYRVLAGIRAAHRNGVVRELVAIALVCLAGASVGLRLQNLVGRLRAVSEARARIWGDPP
jgi:hypothetical protein